MRFLKARTAPQNSSHLDSEAAKRLVRATARGRDERSLYPQPEHELKAEPAPARKRLFWTPDELPEPTDPTAEARALFD